MQAAVRHVNLYFPSIPTIVCHLNWGNGLREYYHLGHVETFRVGQSHNGRTT